MPCKHTCFEHPYPALIGTPGIRCWALGCLWDSLQDSEKYSAGFPAGFSRVGAAGEFCVPSGYSSELTNSREGYAAGIPALEESLWLGSPANFGEWDSEA